jgi:hypothetical protein
MNETTHLPALSFDYVTAAVNSRGILAALREEELHELAERYQRFLSLKTQHPELPIAPTEIIDEMWHLHMLHPRAYYRDCMEYFGFILDHSPGYGADEATRPALERTFNRTAQLWERTFGEPYSMRDREHQNLIICADEEEKEEEREGDEEGNPIAPVQDPSKPDAVPSQRAFIA